MNTELTQSIFAKYLIWHERLAKINKACCDNHPSMCINRLQKIQWALMGSVNSIENGQRHALNIINQKKYKLMLAKDHNGNYINNPSEQINSELLAYIDGLITSVAYLDFRELLMHAYDLLKLPLE